MSLTTADRKPIELRLPRFALSNARWLSPVLLLLLWELGSRSGVIPPRILAAPSTVLGALWELTVSGELPANLVVSLARAAAGLGIGLVVGTVLALVAGLSKVGETAVDPLMQIKRTIPSLALTPLFIVWFGIGEAPKLLLIALATMFPMYLNTYAGVRNVDRKVIEAMRSFGLGGRRLILEVVLPLALPQIFTGLRFALGVSVLVLIAAEQINASVGLGYLLNSAQMYQQVDVILICIAIYAVLGLSADLIVRSLERLFMPWRAGVAIR